MDVFLDIAKATWRLVTFPWFFLILIVLGFAWLWVEKQLTRIGRSISSLQGPIPITPFISSISIFLIIWSKRIIYLWGFLYVGSVIVFYFAQQSSDIPPEITKYVFRIGTFWHDIYALLIGLFF